MQKGSAGSSDGTSGQVIIPRSNFSCNGRITGYLISLERQSGSVAGAPTVQVWHPTSSTEYTKVDTECPLTDSDISMMKDGGDRYYLGTVSCIGNNSIEFQSGDIIGYHQGDSVRYRLWSVNNNGYMAYYYNNEPNPVNISNPDGTLNDRQPLIQVMYGKIIDIILFSFMIAHMHTRVETGSGHPGHPGHILSGSSGSDPLYKLSGSDPDSTLYHMR